jgi:energy-coupling factor transporter ATP-binding protein EcfA2
MQEMKAYVIIGENDSGKSSVTRCLTGSGSSRIRPIATLSSNIRVYVHLSSLQEEKTAPAELEGKVKPEDCEAVIFSLRPGKARGYPDADTYLQYFIKKGWHIIRVACLGDSASRITTSLPEGVIDTFPEVTASETEPAMPANTVAAKVRAHFGWK